RSVPAPGLDSHRAPGQEERRDVGRDGLGVRLHVPARRRLDAQLDLAAPQAHGVVDVTIRLADRDLVGEGQSRLLGGIEDAQDLEVLACPVAGARATAADAVDAPAAARD